MHRMMRLPANSDSVSSDVAAAELATSSAEPPNVTVTDTFEDDEGGEVLTELAEALGTSERALRCSAARASKRFKRARFRWNEA